jgi:hypothetical protein
MRHMILQEVRNFRASVRNPSQMQYSQGQPQPGQQVPIPQGYDHRQFAGQEPGPQEMAGAGGDLERELQGGLDARKKQMA